MSTFGYCATVDGTGCVSDAVMSNDGIVVGLLTCPSVAVVCNVVVGRRESCRCENEPVSM